MSFFKGLIGSAAGQAIAPTSSANPNGPLGQSQNVQNPSSQYTINPMAQGLSGSAMMIDKAQVDEEIAKKKEELRLKFLELSPATREAYLNSLRVREAEEHMYGDVYNHNNTVIVPYHASISQHITYTNVSSSGLISPYALAVKLSLRDLEEIHANDCLEKALDLKEEV